MSESAKKPFERLPTKVVPTHYTLHLTPDLKLFTFDGVVDIDVQVTNECGTSTLRFIAS